MIDALTTAEEQGTEEVPEVKEEPKKELPKSFTPEVPKKKSFFQKVGDYGKQVEKNMKDADPDKMLE